MSFDYCLVSTSGDCAAGGLSKENTFIVLPKDKSFFTIVKSYLRNQMEQDFESSEMPIGKISEKFCKLRDEHHDLGNALIDCGIFEHKWHKRTDWILAELGDDGLPLVSFKARQAKN